MKKVLGLILSFVLGVSLYAADGLMWGEKDIRVAKTQWFDIIYPSRDEASAKLLFNDVDRIYQEIAEDYGFPLQERMPVVLVSSVERFNAMWVSAPYNHIVIYNTEAIEELEVFSEKLLSTFKHEVTHAYTYNLKNKFWKGVSSVFGEPLVLGRVFVTSGMAESATLTSESNTGEGRLNDEYSNQMVKQAKIEDQFPDYYDMQGAASNYPPGSFYYFNGAFMQYMQETYGMDKYALYWYKCVNFQTLTPGMAFKNVYGISLKEAWREFIDNIEIPDVAANPVESGLVKDFFNQNKESYSNFNKQGALYTSLTASEKGFAYIDEKSSSVYFVASEKYYDSEIKPEKLFYHRGLDSVSLSADGKYMAVSYYDAADVAYKHKVAIYDMNSKNWFYIDENNSFKPAIIQKEGEYYLVKVKFTAPVDTICVSKIVVNKSGNRIKTVEPVCEKALDLNEGVNYFVDAGNGQFAYVKNAALNYSVCVSDLEGNVTDEYKAPLERMCIRNLSVNDKGVMFSWTKPESMPRFGMLNFETGVFELSEEDVSGGVYFPVELGESEKIAYVGTFFRENRLFVMDENTFSCGEMVAADDDGGDGEENQILENQITESEPVVSDVPFESVPFNSLAYLSKGYWLPVSSLTSNTYVPGQESSYNMLFGITYQTGLPWTDLSNSALMLTAGYGYDTNSFGFGINYQGGTSTSLFNYSVDLQTEFDFKGWKQSNGTLSLSSRMPFGKSSSVSIAAKSFAQVGKANKLGDYTFDFNDSDDFTGAIIRALTPGNAAPSTRDNYLVNSNAVSLGYSNLWYYGAGKYEKAGFYFSGDFSYYLNKKLTGESETYKNEMNLGGTFGFYVPKLLPFKDVRGFVTNLPLNVEFKLFPMSIASIYSGEDFIHTGFEEFVLNDLLASVNAETVLFGLDIQKSTGSFPLFINDFRISLVYTGVLADTLNNSTSWKIRNLPSYVSRIGSGDGIRYLNTFGLKTVLGITPNFGATANSNFTTKLMSEFAMTQKLDGRFAPCFKLGIDLGF